MPLLLLLHRKLFQQRLLRHLAQCSSLPRRTKNGQCHHSFPYPKGHTRKRRGNAHNSSGFEQQIIREKKRKTAAVSPLYIFSFLLGFNSPTPHLREYARTTIPHPILASANPQPNANPPLFPTLSFGMQTAKLALLTLPPSPPSKAEEAG